MIIVKKTLLIILVSVLLLSPNARSAQQIKRHESIVAYIYNFAKNIHWENEQEISEFNFHFIGDDQGIIDVLNNLAETETLRNRPIKVTSSRSLTDLENIHLLFVETTRESVLSSVLTAIEGKNILLITDGFDDMRRIMINFVNMPDNRLRFEINRANIINENLTILPDMVFLGGTEIDVAKLYKESQDSLRYKEEEIIILGQNLDSLKSQIESSKLAIQVQRNKIDEQESQLENSRQDQQKLQNNITILQGTLSAQHEELEEYDQLMKDLLEEIAEGNETLTNQQVKIESQNYEISRQEKVLEGQKEQITSQKEILYLLTIIVLLVFVLSVFIYQAYKNKQRSNLQLIIQKTKLEELDHLKSLFMASMSHELRTPLNSIIGFSGLISAGRAGNINTVQKKQINIINKNANHLLSLINDILDISKIESGKINLSIEELGIKDVVQEIVETIKPAANEKGLDLILDISEEIRIHSDKRRVKQVLINLVNNAVKFTDEGSVKISAQLSNAGQVEISVIDTGAGVKKEDMNRLFQSFQRIDIASTKRKEGTGLGLYVSRQLMTLLGGDISAKSEYGEGSVFTMILPLRYKGKEIINVK